MIDDASEFVYTALNTPFLPVACWLKGEGTAYTDMKSKDIFVYESFVDGLRMDRFDALKGIIAHEAGHHVASPKSWKNNRVLQNVAALHSKDLAPSVVNLYCDVVVNKFLCEKGFYEVPKVYQNIGDVSDLFANIFELYSRVSGENFGDRSNLDENLLSRLMLVNYSFENDFDQVLGCYNFSKIISNYVPSDFAYEDIVYDRVPKSGGSSWGIVKGTGASKSLKNVDDSDQCVQGSDLDGLVDFYERANKPFCDPMFSGKGDSRGYKPFGVDEPFENYSPIKSFGTFLPGIAKVKFTDFQDLHVADCMVGIDSSASMSDPAKDLSKAVLAAFAICDSYLARGSKVGAFNFSDVTLYQEYTSNDKLIKKLLCTYQDGGTSLNPGGVVNKLKSGSDSFVITDAEFDEFDNLVNEFSSLKKGNHFLINVGQDSFCFSRGNLSVRGMKSVDDLEFIVREKLKQNGIQK